MVYKGRMVGKWVMKLVGSWGLIIDAAKRVRGLRYTFRRVMNGMICGERMAMHLYTSLHGCTGLYSSTL
jgi:hypothetical protein